MEPNFPATPEEIGPWRKRHGATADEARKRFMQYAVLESIASDHGLAHAIAFKGGNALRFIYGNRRSTLDLDFTADGDFPDDDEEIRRRLDEALRSALPRFRVKARCQRVRRNPPGREKTRPTYDISVGYLLPGDRQYHNFAESLSVSSTIDVEISLNEVVCEAAMRRMTPIGRELRVCTLDAIVAEKLRALLQQAIRRRSRPQDVYDIASILHRLGETLDLEKVARFLIRKAESREIVARKGGFDARTRDLAATGYDAEIRPNAPEFIPFEGAWSAVLDLVSRLEIPD